MDAPHCILTVHQARVALSEVKRVGLTPKAQELLERALLRYRRENNLNNRFKRYKNYPGEPA